MPAARELWMAAIVRGRSAVSVEISVRSRSTAKAVTRRGK